MGLRNFNNRKIKEVNVVVFCGPWPTDGTVFMNTDHERIPNVSDNRTLNVKSSS